MSSTRQSKLLLELGTFLQPRFHPAVNASYLKHAKKNREERHRRTSLGQQRRRQGGGNGQQQGDFDESSLASLGAAEDESARANKVKHRAEQLPFGDPIHCGSSCAGAKDRASSPARRACRRAEVIHERAQVS
jgi:hypothetical protein